MIAGIYGSLSGMTGAQTRITTAAHNTANANTDGFKKHRALHQEAHHQGIETTVEQVNTPGPIVARATDSDLVDVELSNVDLGEEAVSLLLGKRMFEANLNALKIQDELIGNVVDVLE